MQVTGRLGGSEAVPPPYYYLLNGLANFALSFPFALIASVVVIKTAWPQLGIPLLKKPSRGEWDTMLRMAILMVAWFLVILVGLSIPQARKSRYLLPAVPAIAALAAYIFVAQGNKLLSASYWILQKILFILPAFLAVITIYAMHYARQRGLSIEFHSTLLLFLLVSYQCIQLCSIYYLKKRVELRDKIFVAVAVLAFWSTNVLLREPVEIQLHRARSFVQTVETIRQQNPSPLEMYGMNRDGIAIVYHVNVQGGFKPQFIDKPEQFAKLHYPLYLLISRQNIEVLQSTSLPSHQVEWPRPIYEGFFRDGRYHVYFLTASPVHY